ncbi:MAG: nuclear transport factor 2 family protein, partial [Kiloniellales bacterium]|nr:nuclear transport factor 2 family protein [Kiloniellales bacterium]
MSQAAAVLFVNEAFYAAFRDRDFATLEALWARRAPVACIHPGWQALDDREEI